MRELPPTPAPALTLSNWFNSREPPALIHQRGKVVVIYAFQMLCPGCVSHSLPQARKVRDYFSPEDVYVLGLHSVFEHHQAMTDTALKAFLQEYRLDFPVAVDAPAAQGPTPVTMTRYALQGTPSLLLIDRQGYLRVKAFGAVDDLQLGHWLGRLLSLSATAKLDNPSPPVPTQGACGDGLCPVD